MRKRPHQKYNSLKSKLFNQYYYKANGNFTISNSNSNSNRVNSWDGVVGSGGNIQNWYDEVLKDNYFFKSIQSKTTTLSSTKPLKPEIPGNPFKRLKGKVIRKLL